MVIRGKPELVDDYLDTVTNPVVIIEVLSDSTKDYDRGQKFESYRTLVSLREYPTVAQDKIHVELYTRQADHRWLLTEYRDPAARIRLDSLEIELPVSEIYEKVEF